MFVRRRTFLTMTRFYYQRFLCSNTTCWADYLFVYKKNKLRIVNTSKNVLEVY